MAKTTCLLTEVHFIKYFVGERETHSKQKLQMLYVRVSPQKLKKISFMFNKSCIKTLYRKLSIYAQMFAF